MANITSCTKSGLKDWFLQRVSAIIIMLYALFIIIVLFCMSNHGSYHQWMAIFSDGWVKVFTILAFLSVVAHAWIGMWTIFTDYVKCAYLRGFLQVAAIVGYLACFIWLICILF